MRGNAEHSGFAKGMRRQPTDAEKVLWRHLRNRQLAGVKFRRQEPIGPFIVDFVAMDLHLIIELDGGQHEVAGDARRTAILEDDGYRLIRFWNNDVLQNPDGVLAKILEVITEMKE